MRCTWRGCPAHFRRMFNLQCTGCLLYTSNKVDMDELIQKNVDKMNKKRAKKGLPPAKVNQNASANLKNIQAQTEKEEQLRNEKLSKIDRQVKESTEFYNSDPKPGSLASKAKMVQKYNEKHNK